MGMIFKGQAQAKTAARIAYVNLDLKEMRLWNSRHSIYEVPKMQK
jgi:hypothetical protein